jgi:hypothetical protein
MKISEVQTDKASIKQVMCLSLQSLLMLLNSIGHLLCKAVVRRVRKRLGKKN